MPDYTEMLESLHAAGRRLTPQREGVLAVIAASDTHLTAEQIIARIRKRYPYLNKASVYRSLDLLTELGLVTQTDLGRGRIEYELHRHPHHHHLVCRNCHRIDEIDQAVLASLAKKLESEFGFKPYLDHFAIFGICRRCQRKTQQ